MPWDNDDDWGEPQTQGNIWDLNDGALVGIYRGFREVNGDYGVSKLHEFECEDGRYNVWGKTHLDRLLDGRNGEMVKIALTGNKINLGGGRTMIEYVLWSKGRVTPALPQTPLPASETASQGPPPFPQPEGPVGDSEAAQVRARRIAISAKDAGIDDEMRAELIDYWTFGETKSAKDLDEKQFQGLYELIQKIRRGKAEIRYNEKGQLFVEANDGRKVAPK